MADLEHLDITTVEGYTPKEERASVRWLNVHPPGYESWAYQLWAFVCGRSCPAVQQRIANPREGDPLEARDIPLRTIQQWATDHKWAAKVGNDWEKIAPELHGAIDQTLMLTSAKGSQWMLDVMNGDVAMNTKEEIAAARVKSEIVRTALDRAGFIPWLTSPERSKPPAPAASSVSIGQMSDEELVAHLNRRLAVLTESSEWTDDDVADS